MYMSEIPIVKRKYIAKRFFRGNYLNFNRYIGKSFYKSILIGGISDKMNYLCVVFMLCK